MIQQIPPGESKAPSLVEPVKGPEEVEVDPPLVAVAVDPQPAEGTELPATPKADVRPEMGRDELHQFFGEVGFVEFDFFTGGIFWMFFF